MAPAPPADYLAAGASCTQDLELLPVTAGTSSGSVVFTGAGVVPQSILLTGTATVSPTTITLTSNVNPALAGQPITYTAVVVPLGLGTPTGTIAFAAAGTPFSTQTLPPGGVTAIAANVSIATGTDNITAVYSGNSSFTGSTSPAIPQLVEDFIITLTPQPNNPAGSTSRTVIPGKAVTFKFALTPLLGPFNFPITLSAAGLPPAAIATFTPQTSTPGTNPTSFTMTIQTAANQGSLQHKRSMGGGAQAGGGLDYRLSQHVAVRAVEAAWQHTQLPNGTNNIQNDLLLGAGIVVRFGQ